MDGKAKVTVWLEMKNKLKQGFNQGRDYINKNISEFKGKLSGLTNSFVTNFKSMAAQIPGLGNALSLLANPIGLVAAAVVALAGAYAHASRMAHQFESAMLKANVTAQESRADFKKTSAHVLDVAANSKLDNAVQATPQAYNILLSAGMDKDTALKTLEPTLQAAKAGFTDVEVVAKAAAASMNSSGITDATRVYDILFATLNKGNAEFQDIANYLPKIIPVAKNVGINMEQVAGAYAYLTAQGQTAERSATLLENAFKVLGDPEKVEKFKKIGVTIFDQAGKVKPLTSIINDLNVALRGLTDEKRTKVLDFLGLDMEAAGAFSALSMDAAKFKEIIDFTTNSQGQLTKAIDASSSSMDNFTLFSNQVDSAWVKIGERVNEALGDGAEWMKPFMEEWMPVIVEGFGMLFEYLARTFKMLTFMPRKIMEWTSKSEFLKDIFSAIGTIIKGVFDIVGWVVDKIEWLFDHTIGPMLDAIDWVYGKIKSLNPFSSGDKKEEYVPASSAEYNKRLDNAKNFSWNDAENLTNMGNPLKPIPLNMYKPEEQPNAKVKGVLSEIDKNKKKKDDGGISSGTQTRIITINKLSIVEGNFISNNPQIANMDKTEIERFFDEMIQRAFVNLGKSYGGA
jgi:TP901 family phage tail tape measure protein